MALFDLQAMFTADEIAAMGVFENMFTAEPTDEADLSSLNREIPRPESPWNAEKLNAEARERQEKQTRGQAWFNSNFLDGYNDEPSAGTAWANSAFHVDSESKKSAFPKSPYFEDYNDEQPSSTSGGDYHRESDASEKSDYCQEHCTEPTSFNTKHADGPVLETPYDFTQFLNDDDIELLNSFHFEDLFTKEDEEEPANLKFPKGHFTSTFTSTAHEKAKLNYPKRKPHRRATRADVIRWKLPPGLVLSSWDPSEEPILLLATAFDSFSLGNWIYDWAFNCDGVDSHIVELADNLWRLLIKLTGKVKHAEAVVKTIQNKDDREMIQDFIKSAHRQLNKLRGIIHQTEEPMLKTIVEKGTKAGEKPNLGKEAGHAFIDAFFGDPLWERVHRFMVGLKLWNFRFDANCDEIMSAYPQ